MTINCKGQLIDLSSPKVMGILNITPDSFYDGGSYKNEKDILKKVETMLNEGATFIDVGAYSSRPNANHVSETDELKRILPIVDLILKVFPKALLSIDTFRSKVAKSCIESGACMINDISAGKLDDTMLQTIADLHVPYIMMHMRGTPQNMQQQTDYNDLIKDIIFYFSERITAAKQLGIVDVIIDPGFGFAKTLEQNFKVMLETGGHISVEKVPEEVVKIVDVKTPSSKMSHKNFYENLSLIDEKDELKFVIGSREDYIWAKELLEKNDTKGKVLFSPVWNELEPEKLVAWILEDKLKVRFQLQMHKVVWAAETQGV